MKIKATATVLAVLFILVLASCGTKNQEYNVGTEIGEKLPSASLQIFDEHGLLGEYIDPSNLGKVTVINFWGTWCPYCLHELPGFDELASEYGDEIAIVAIHTEYLFSETAVDYVYSDYQDSSIIFAKDTSSNPRRDDDCYSKYGGLGSYPYTIILDKNGFITDKVYGAMSKEALQEKIEAAK